MNTTRTEPEVFQNKFEASGLTDQKSYVFLLMVLSLVGIGAIAVFVNLFDHAVFGI